MRSLKMFLLLRAYYTMIANDPILSRTRPALKPPVLPAGGQVNNKQRCRPAMLPAVLERDTPGAADPYPLSAAAVHPGVLEAVTVIY